MRDRIMLICEDEETFRKAAATVSGTGFVPVKPWSGPADCLVIVDCNFDLYEKAKEHGEKLGVPTLFARNVRCLETLLERMSRFGA
ncbi:MAG: hypothetical protein AB1330_10400 [Bacillota bacterium]